jgi:hypothetical protein
MQPSRLITSLPSDLLGRYKVILELKDPTGELLRRFEKTLRDVPGAAYLEALTFSMFQGYFRLQPEINDDPSIGGADFKMLVNPAEPMFAECKYLERGVVAANSSIPDDVMAPGGSYSQITDQIQTRVKGATSQLALGHGPGIAVIGTDHANASDLMGAHAAETLLTSTTHIEVPISRQTGSATGPAEVVAPLKNSVFLARPPRPGDDLARLRIPVSAVLLVTFNFDERTASLVGILNPWPKYPLNIRQFPRVPFARFAGEPTISQVTLPPVEWVVHAPDPLPVQPVLPPDIPEHQIRGENPPTPLM